MKMKQFLTFAFLMVGTLAFGQKQVDPSYAANNYKHANKAAYARKHNLDKSPELKLVSVTDNGDYKHPGRKAKATKKAALSTGTESTSHKHPLGL
jgi:hypothetical protein